MHVHVYDLCGNVDKEHIKRVLPFHEICGIGVGDSGRDRIVYDKAPVHKSTLVCPVRFRIGGLPQKAADADPVLFGVNAVAFPHGGAAVHCRESLFLAPAERLQRRLSVDEIAKGDLRVPENEPRDDRRDLALLALVRFEELLPHGRIEKEILRTNIRARILRAGLGLAEFSARADKLIGSLRAPKTGAQAHIRDRRDARKRLAAEPERLYSFKILRPRDLAGRMRQKGGTQLPSLDPLSVVRNADEVLPAALYPDGDIFRTRVDGVLHELFDDGRGPLYDFARGDPVVDAALKNVYLCHCIAPLPARQVRTGPPAPAAASGRPC